MTPPWWGIPVVLVVGIAVIVAGWWWDRRRIRRASEGFTTDEDLATRSPSRTLPDDEVTALLGARGPAPTIPGGLAHRAFVTHPQRGVAVVRGPIVVVTDADVEEERLVLPLLDAARSAGRALVLVAASFGFDVLGTLRANLLTDRVTTLPVELADPDLLASVAERCGCRVVPDADLRSGWLPPDVFGSCPAWVADSDDSWIVDAPPAD